MLALTMQLYLTSQAPAGSGAGTGIGSGGRTGTGYDNTGSGGYDNTSRDTGYGGSGAATGAGTGELPRVAAIPYAARVTCCCT